MANRSIPFAVTLLSFLLSMASCQDHHWKSYDQIGALPPPEKPFHGSLVSGQVQLGDSVKMRDFKGWSLFVIARSAEGASMLAATKETVSSFPVPFIITTKHMMLGKVKQGDKLMVEAKLDKDGILDTKDEITVTGKAKEPCELGFDKSLIYVDMESK